MACDGQVGAVTRREEEPVTCLGAVCRSMPSFASRWNSHVASVLLGVISSRYSIAAKSMRKRYHVPDAIVMVGSS